MPIDQTNPIFLESVSNYIVFGLGILVSLAVWLIGRWISRKRPRRVLIIRTNETSLVSVDSTVNTDDLQITFKGKVATSVHFTKFRIVNDSDQIIDSPSVEIMVDKGTILDVQLVDPLVARQSANKILSAGSIRIELPYLNPNKLYKDAPHVQVFSSDRLVVKEVIGGGREWRTDYIDYASEAQKVVNELELSVGFFPTVTTSLRMLGMSDRVIRLLRILSKING